MKKTRGWAGRSDQSTHGDAVESGMPLDPSCDPRLAIDADSPTVLRIILDSPCATVVSTDRPHVPGWKAAFINGEKVAVERANFAFMAVQVPAGQHIVELFYRPHTLLLGFWISLISLAVLCGVAIFSSRRER